MTSEQKIIPRPAVVASLLSLRPSQHNEAVIVNLTGLKDTGKSKVLRLLYEHLAPTVPVVWIDFAPQPESPGDPAPTSLSDIITHLNERVEALEYLSFEQVPVDACAIDDVSSPDGSLRAVLRMSVDDVDAASPLVVLLDHINELQAWKWIQKELLTPLSEQPALIVCASHDALSWDYWLLRNACTRQDIPPFTAAEAAAYFAQHGGYQVPAIIIPALIDEELYPYTLKEEVREFQKQVGDWPVPPSVALPLATLPDSDPLLYYCGWLRMFQIDVMMELLTLPALEAVLTLPHDPRERRGMLRTALTTWRQKQYIHVSDTTERLIQHLRHTLAQHVSRHDSQHYQAIANRAAEIYDQRARAGSATSEKLRSFLEWLYYSTTPFLASDPEDARSAWEAHLKDLLQASGLPGSLLAVSLYRDQEVVHRLHETGRLSVVDTEIQAHTTTAAQPLTTEQRKRRQAVQQRILATWNNNPTLAPVKTAYPGGIKVLLADIAQRTDQHDCFTTTDLRSMMQQAGVDQSARRGIIRAIQEAGLVQYDQHSQQFTLEPAARNLLNEDEHVSGSRRARIREGEEHDSST
jgi:hypothetical protein